MFKKEFMENNCKCKYVGCHINDERRWCKILQNEIPYDRCNEYCKFHNASKWKIIKSIVKLPKSNTGVECFINDKCI